MNLPTGTVTFLFTDIEGSTHLWEHHPEPMRIALARHDALLRQAIEANFGTVFKTIGDAFCAAFATAPQALAAALAAQSALVTEPWELPAPLRVRMALHTGSAEARESDYFGPPLNRVARLMATGHGGQVLLSQVAQELTCDALPVGVRLSDLGEHRLKDLARPERVFQLQHPALPSDFPPLRSLDNPDLPNNLPQQTTTFIGREKEIAEVKALLKKTRLLTLTGAGGSGKTRLALQVAADLLETENDGVWLVELAALTDPALVPQVTANALNIQEQPGKTNRRTLLDTLKNKRLLIVLDNCEHLVDACASLAADLLRSCPHICILASSREPLNVTGETAYRLPSLSLPDPKVKQTSESLTQYEAVRLFIARAQAACPGFTITNANAPAVAQICVALDGIPLALELAAARVRSLSVEEIMARLDKRFRLLTGGSRTALPRQQTLRALIDWSYELLTDQTKLLLGRLSVFAGGCTLAAVEEVCSGDGIEEWEALDLLTSLVDKSLVVYDAQETGASRYRLLETVRQYGHERLESSEEPTAVRSRHRDYFLALAERVEPLLAGPEQIRWLPVLEQEHDNMRAALAWCEKESAVRSQEIELWLRLALALWRFWAVRCFWSEGFQWFERALTQASSPSGEANVSLPIRARALLKAGSLRASIGENEQARIYYEQSLNLSRQTGDKKVVAATLSNLGNMALDQGDSVGSQTYQEESLALFEEIGDLEGIGTSLHRLGAVADYTRDFDASKAYYLRSLTIRRTLGNPTHIATSLTCLALNAGQLRDFVTAHALFEESLARHQQIGDKTGTLYVLGTSGEMAIREGDYDRACSLLGKSLRMSMQLDLKEEAVASLESLAHTSFLKGDLIYAVRLWSVATTVREQIGIPLSRHDQSEQEQRTNRALQDLGSAAYAQEWEIGQKMTLNQAAEYALSQCDD